MNNSKKHNNIKVKKEEQRKWLIYAITSVFLIYMFTVFPLIFHNKYFDITVTKYNALRIGVLVYAVLMALAWILKLTDKRYETHKITEKRKKIYASDIFMLLFLIASYMAYIMADDSHNAFYGVNGRRCGLLFVIIIAVMYICVGSGYKLEKNIFYIWGIASGLTYVMGIIQQFDIDIFNMLENVNDFQHPLFISTFGNINTFASYLCITVVLFAGLFIYEEEKAGKIIYGITLFMAGGAIVAANSDVTYGGCGAGLIILLLISIYYGRLAEYLLSTIILCSGYGVVAVITGITDRGAYKLSGISRLAAYPMAVLALLAALVILFLLFRYSNKGDKHQNNNSCLERRKETILVALIIAAALLTVIIVGIINKWSIFVFNDLWGNYRGFVWNRLCKIYNDFPLLKKIFGNGNETIRALMSEYYYEEMYDLTGTVYDSAHNEYLQYLVTAGLFGLVSYVGLCVSTIVNGVKLSGELRKSKERNISKQLCVPEMSVTDMLPLIMVAAYAAYLVQAVFNVIQPITTPYAFLLVAMLAGMRRAGGSETL
jgi:hypothetical protein